jgi:hypothetical protein
MKGNLGKAVKIAQSMPPVGLASAVAGAGGRVGPVAVAGDAAKLGVPSPAGPLGASTAMMTKHGEGEGSGGSEKPGPKPAADEPAKLDDASFTNSAKPPERVTVQRIAARPEFKGRTFRAPPPPDPGFDWMDDLGRTFDAMGDGTTSKYFKFRSFKAAIDHHLLKGNTFTVIDMTGYTVDQIAEVRAYVDTLPAGHIIRVGF